MDRLSINLFVRLFLSGIFTRSTFASPSIQYGSLQMPGSSRLPVPQQLEAPAEERVQVNTVKVTCQPDSLEILIKADMFGVGAPVYGEELRLGVEHNDFCTAAVSTAEEYIIVVGLLDCGTQHWMTEDSLVYTNLLIYTPLDSADGLIRMEEAVIPIECHYDRKYRLSSSSLTPTWIPFMSTQAAVETLAFDLRLMTNDWQYERSSNVYHLGEPIGIEASVRVGHHMGLRVFVSSCVATLDPDIHSAPRYVFIEDGCLVDSQLPGSKSHFYPRTQDDKLHLVIDAFRFHNEDMGQLYITCHMTAVTVHDSQSWNKACTFVNGRWRSADSNDYMCGYCQSQNEVGQTGSKPSIPGKVGPRGSGRMDGPEAFNKSSPTTNDDVWDHEAKVGPILVLPAKTSGPIPLEELPPVLGKISRPALYGSQWRSGVKKEVDLEKELAPGPSTPDQGELRAAASTQNGTDNETDIEGDITAGDIAAALEETAVLENNSTAAASVSNHTDQITMDVTMPTNATATDATESDLSDTNDRKK